MRSVYGLNQGNDALLRSCGVQNGDEMDALFMDPDGASMRIVCGAWEKLCNETE